MNASRLMIEGCAVATADPSGSEYGSGHLAETKDEEEFCLEQYGVRPVEYLEDLGWLGDNVWLAHCVHLNEAEIGSLEPGKRADIALWRMDGVVHAGISDPKAALVLGPAPRVELLLVGGRPVVENAELRTAEELEIAREIASASRRLAEKMEVAS